MKSISTLPTAEQCSTSINQAEVRGLLDKAFNEAIARAKSKAATG